MKFEQPSIILLACPMAFSCIICNLVFISRSGQSRLPPLLLFASSNVLPGWAPLLVSDNK
jgi:hypothetical protein